MTETDSLKLPEAYLSQIPSSDNARKTSFTKRVGILYISRVRKDSTVSPRNSFYGVETFEETMRRKKYELRVRRYRFKKELEAVFWGKRLGGPDRI